MIRIAPVCSTKLAAVALLLAVSSVGSVEAKNCVQLTGGACQGHWACTTAGGAAGFCNDDGAKDCYCKEGKKSRGHTAHRALSEDNPLYMENYTSPNTLPSNSGRNASQNTGTPPPNMPRDDKGPTHGSNNPNDQLPDVPLMRPENVPPQNPASPP